jgi:hypothetical protein
MDKRHVGKVNLTPKGERIHLYEPCIHDSSACKDSRAVYGHCFCILEFSGVLHTSPGTPLNFYRIFPWMEHI